VKIVAPFLVILLLSGCSALYPFYSKEMKFEAAGIGKDGIYRSNFNKEEDILIKMTSAKTKEGEKYRIIYTLRIPSNSTQADFNIGDKFVAKYDCSKKYCKPNDDLDEIVVEWVEPERGAFLGGISLRNLRPIKIY
jgi:hypothetical protein